MGVAAVATAVWIVAAGDAVDAQRPFERGIASRIAVLCQPRAPSQHLAAAGYAGALLGRSVSVTQAVRGAERSLRWSRGVEVRGHPAAGRRAVCETACEDARGAKKGARDGTEVP